MDKPAWKIIFTRFEGIQRRAVELLQREIGRQVIREKGRYILHVLPCEKNAEIVAVEDNAVIIGAWSENAMMQRYVVPSEIPEDGYAVKVLGNPERPAGKLVLITAREERMLYAGAVAFLDDYAVRNMTCHGGLRYPDRIFDFPLPEDTITSRPLAPVRSIFAWGHAINDYRAYIVNMARLKLNRLILWNDYIPLNIKEVIDYAHSFGIEVFSGFAWGWIDGCGNITSIEDDVLDGIKRKVLTSFETDYSHYGFDGIYFQSFTEMCNDRIGNRLVATYVTQLVNDIAAELFKCYPKLNIEFGLHAKSVRTHLDEIAKVDPRIEILWEDCGEFPYAYIPVVEDEAKFQETMEFTERIITLRPHAPVGLMFKGFATLDWCDGLFRYQCGPYIMGENDPEVARHDWQLREDCWRVFSAEWCRYGNYAARLAKKALEWADGKIHFSMAEVFDGPIQLPTAICSEIFWNPNDDYEEMLERVSKRPALRRG